MPLTFTMTVQRGNITLGPCPHQDRASTTTGEEGSLSRRRQHPRPRTPIHKRERSKQAPPEDGSHST